ncbi:MAG: magnesium transporter [Immundisolibacteraceae bacterium]|nr:magnesium transporter [Immundisolibacteraceae bacterium]
MTNRRPPQGDFIKAIDVTMTEKPNHENLTLQPTANCSEEEFTQLVESVIRRAPMDAAGLLTDLSDHDLVKVLESVDPTFALKILYCLPDERQEEVAEDITEQIADRWSLNQQYDPDTVGRVMEKPVGVFHYTDTAVDTINEIRELAKTTLPTYVYVLDDVDQLYGVVVMRDLMLADPTQTLAQVMLREPFSLSAETTIGDAMQAVVHRHYPVYPVCDSLNRLIGLVPGYTLFEEQRVELMSRPGRMVGVEQEETINTPWRTCLKFRHPWLQLNLLTAFLAALVVGLFEETIQQVVVLAAFLPVLAGQSGNTGCQSLAVTLRGLTLGEFAQLKTGSIVRKEAALGCANGLLVGVIAAVAMYFYAAATGGNPTLLALVVLVAMTGSCVLSGVTGVLVPMALKKVGADPVTASSIFVTTATDVCSMGLLLALATLVI